MTSSKDDLGQFHAVSMVMEFGDVVSKTKKESNDWKLRMLKAGMGKMGLKVPEDWDTLSEKEKEKRLNGVMEVLKS